MVKNQLQRRRRVAWEAIESEAGVFTEILSRLPVKSIRKFKGVNRYWRRSIKDNYTVRKQLSQAREKRCYIACPSMNRTMKLYVLKPNRFRFEHLTTVDPPARSVEDYMYMVASFNGLVCCINQVPVENEDHYWDLQIWICNPCTKDILLLPQGRLSFGIEPHIGVAYGPELSEYKVFRIFGVADASPECEVYSSSSGAWRNIGTVPRLPTHVCFSPFKSTHVFASGKIYWLVSFEGRDEILSVDMQERFEVIKLPKYSEDVAIYLITLGGSLSVVILYADYMDIWVWEEGPRTWKFVTWEELRFKNYEAVVFMTSSKNEILMATETHLWRYGLDTGKWKKVRRPPTEFVNPTMFPFTESLVSCRTG